MYEYDVVYLVDSSLGTIDVDKLRETLRIHGEQGWRLVNTFTNEIGRNTTSAGYGGMSSGTNATIDQTILVFERCLRRYNL